MFRNTIFLLLLLHCVYSVPQCPSMKYHDFVWESGYSLPPASDRLIEQCNNLINQSDCQDIFSSNLSVWEKKRVILDIMSNVSKAPDFDYTKEASKNITIGKNPPVGIATKTSGAIKDAWVKIGYITPSVYENKNILVNSSGTARSEFAFTMAVPSGKIGSDCKTDYSVCGYDYDLKTYLNGTYLANNNSKDAYFSISDDANLTFSSILSVNSLYLVYRYHWVKHCSKWSCWYTCDYYKTENRADSVTVSDSLNATYLNFTSYEKTLVENSGNMLDAWLETQTNGSFRSFELSSGNSYLQKRKYWYRLGYTLDPYDVLVWESMPAYEDTTVKNGIIEKNIEDRNSSYEKTHFLLNSDKQSCDLEITSHFTSQFFPNFCNITTNKPIINLTANNGTVSVFFYENSTKKPLANKNISLFYGGNSTNLITDSNGKATKTITDYEKGGPIKASFETDMETKSASAVIIVPAKQPEIIDKTLELLTSAGALAVIYKAMKVSL